MSIGLVPTGGIFGKFANNVRNFLHDSIQAKLAQAGKRIVDTAQSLAPVDTGALRDSIGFTIRDDNTLSIHVDKEYGVYQEFGTRNMMPHPYIRPAILQEMPRIMGSSTEMQFAGTEGFSGLLASTGKGSMPGYAASARPGWKPLTSKQARHVEKHLIPSVKYYHRGAVKRARFRVSTH